MKARHSNNTRLTAKQKLQVAMLVLMIAGIVILGLVKVFIVIDLWTK